MMKKDRLIYLDFVRVIAMFMIITYHFCVHLNSYNIVGLNIFSNSRWGLIGVTLFFIVSGASLMYNYGDKIDLKKYYKKRFWGIYPMFWLAYIGVFIYLFMACKGIPFNLPGYKIIYSIMGLDGYLSSFIKTFYILGEWFLGAIIIIYLIFPILQFIINKKPILLVLIMILLLIIAYVFLGHTKLPIQYNIIICIFEFVIGMVIVKYNISSSFTKSLVSLLVIILFIAISNKVINNIPLFVFLSKTSAVFLFIILSYLSKYAAKLIFLKNIIMLFSKYSYSTFLIHHFMIMKILERFTNTNFEMKNMVCLYIGTLFVIFINSYFLYNINYKIVSGCGGETHEKKQ